MDCVQTERFFTVITASAAKHLAADATTVSALSGSIRQRLEQGVTAPCQVSGQLRLAMQKLREARDALTRIMQYEVADADTLSALHDALACLLPDQGVLIERAIKQLHTLTDAARPVESAAIRTEILEVKALLSAAVCNHDEAIAELEQALRLDDVPPADVWRLLHRMAWLNAEVGRETMDNTRLAAAIELLQGRALGLAADNRRSDNLATTQDSIGVMKGILGQRENATGLLREAIASFLAALQIRCRENSPVAWAETQNNLGNAQGALGFRQNDETMLKAARVSFENALEVRIESSMPAEWAATQNNLAALLQGIGARNRDARLLKMAVAAYKKVLRVWTRDQVPLEWAATMNNLGTALRLLGEHRKGPRTLQQSVAAYRSSLAERIRERVPEEWAMTQNNLGAALQRLAIRQDDAEIMAQAVAAYGNALKEWPFAKGPTTWAMTKANLAVAKRDLAEKRGDAIMANHAVEDLQDAVNVFRGASHAQYTELGEEQLCEARRLAESLAGQKGDAAPPGKV